MLFTDIKKKEVISVKEMVDMYKENVENIKKELENIDEKYKKLAEEEKKELKETLSECKSQQKVWEKMFNSFDTTLVKEILGEGYQTDSTDTKEVAVETVNTTVDETPVDNGEQPTPVEEEPEKVIDKLFEENNAPETEEEKEETEEPIIESGPSGELEKSEEEKALEDIWPDDENKTEDKKEDDGESLEVTDNANDWPDMPEGWN